MGISDEILERARNHLSGDATDMEHLLRDLEGQRENLENERQQATLHRERLATSLSEQEELVRSLRSERDQFLREKKRRLSAEIRDARAKVRDAIKNLSAARNRIAVEHVRRDLRSIEEEMRPSPLLSKKAAKPLGRVQPGDAVEVLPIGQKGILLDDPSKSRGRVRVKVGSIEVLVDEGSLGGVEGEGGPIQTGGVASVESEPKPDRDIPGKIDLRGMRVEEALPAVERYLDEALLSRREEVLIIHGHGTGALKKAVREWLSGCSFIQGHRPGDRYEGGDGATVVMLKRQTSHISNAND
jgi:DNA mismatch repair protein MutS2